MAALTTKELALLRQLVSAGLIEVNYQKAQINTALQAIEDWFDKPAVQASLNGDIEAVVAGVFTVPEKKRLVKFWLQHRFGKE